MKKLLFLIVFFLVLIIPSSVFAQPMMGSTALDDHTTREEAEGKEIWDKLQAKQLECKNLTDDDYGSLGEYFMGQMMGSTHEAMNNMMEKKMGKEGEVQVHVVMGKRLSGCDTSASYPVSGAGFIPMMGMMQMMGGGGNPMMGYGGWNNMMGGFGIFGWLSMIIFLLLLILAVLAVIALVKWLTTSGRTDYSKTPLEILKERYAKGEVDKKEFEQMKKELS